LHFSPLLEERGEVGERLGVRLQIIF